jgi:NADPH:quinone reductase-like Zn-dependent oxidoreductase
MKAIVNHEYGSPDVLKIEEVEKPAPRDDEVLIKVHATSINTADWFCLTGKPFLVRLDPGGLLKPKTTILGGDVAGRVTAVGDNVRQFQVGDEIYGDISDSGMGAFAVYVTAPENVVAGKPGNLSFEEAAAVPSAGVTALQGIRNHGEIQSGDNVIIVGASGGVGTYAVQIAKSFGAEVTAVCSTGKVELVRSIGADHVIDYTKQNFSQNGG